MLTRLRVGALQDAAPDADTASAAAIIPVSIQLHVLLWRHMSTFTAVEKKLPWSRTSC